TDYTVSYSNNTDVGTAGVTITGTGNYSGSLETSFEIIPIDTSGPSPEQISAHSGEDQQATVGTALADTVSVFVSDRYSNPVAGAEVTFVITAGGGEFPGGAADTVMVTNKDGIAASPAWTLGPAPGENRLEAVVESLSGSPVVFTATALTGTAEQMTAHSGEDQQATVGTALADTVSVFVSDRYSNPVAGAEVTFRITAGGGEFPGGAADTVMVTNKDGIAASPAWTLGPAPGENRLEAVVES
ncbi:hypothetical protein ACFSVN_05040, partial [Gracilimonas halophila]